MSALPIRVQAAAQAAPVKVQGLAGIAGRFIELASDDGQWMLRVPRSAFPRLDTNPGDILILTLGLVAVTADEDAADKPGLIIPGKGH